MRQFHIEFSYNFVKEKNKVYIKDSYRFNGMMTLVKGCYKNQQRIIVQIS